MVYTDAGEDLIASCAACGYAANMEKATSRLAPVEDLEPTGDGKPELVHTPGKAAIADVAAFFEISPAARHQDRGIHGRSSVAKHGEMEAVVAFLRGDHSVNETKLMALDRRGADCAPCTPRNSRPAFRRPGGLSSARSA